MANKIKKIYLYPVIIETHQEGGYHAKCPLLQGAWADGETIEEVVDNLRDVIRLILQYRRERRKKMTAVPIIPAAKAKLLKDLNVAVYA